MFNFRFHIEEDEELAGYFSPKHSQSQHNLLDQEENRRVVKQSSSSDHSPRQSQNQNYTEKPYQELTSPGQLESLSEHNELSSGKWAEPREQASKTTLQRSPSSYEIHQLSPSKQTVVKGRGYSCQRSQSDLHLSLDKRATNRLTSDTDNNLYQVQSVSHEHYSPRTFTREPRRNRSSFHESSHSRSDLSGSNASRRYSTDCSKFVSGDPESHPKSLSGSLTWRKPKDLFSQSEWNKENFDSENNAFQSSDDPKSSEDQGGVVSFANLSKQKNNSGTAINIVYSHQDKEIDQGTYKKPVRPGYLHINKSHTVGDNISPTSSNNIQEWTKNSKGISATDSSIAAQMYDIRLKLEEKRKRIEQEKALLESLSKRQREKMGKAAFLQAVKGTGSPGRDDNIYSKNRQFSVEDISEDLDTVRRRWLERKSSELEIENDAQSEDIQLSIDQLNCSLSDLQLDISRLTEQQEMIQKLLKSGTPPQNDIQAYFLHDQTTPAQNKMPSKWAEPVNTYQNNSNMYSQNMMSSDIHQQVSGRGHWGQPVIPFGGYQQPPAQHQNIPMWQQSSQALRPASVEPQMMYSQPMNMQPHMYEQPPSNQVPFNQGFTLHPQQQVQQSNYSNFYNPNPYYPNDIQHSNVPNQGQYNYSNYHQTNYPVIQNAFGQSAQMGLKRSESRGFHLHPESSDYMPDDVDTYSNNQGPHNMQINAFQSESQPSNSNHGINNSLTISVDEFGRPTRSSDLQHSPPNRPVLGKTFRVPKSKVASPSSPNYKQQPSETTVPSQEQNVQEEPPEVQTNPKQLGDKGFYISFEEEPRKPKPKLKPKHLKARNQQKKIDCESRKAETNEFSSEIGESNEDEQFRKESQAALERTDTIDGHTSESSETHPSQPVQSGVGFVVDNGIVENDPVS